MRLEQRLRDIIFSSNRYLRNLAVNCYGYYLKRRRFTRGFWEELSRLEELEDLPSDLQRELQSHLLAGMVRHAYEHSAYYHRRFIDYGITPDQIQDVADLDRLPILTRDDIRAHYADLTADNISRGSKSVHSTSGTTGTKLTFTISNQLQWTIKFAHLYRHYAWAGISPADRRVTLGGRLFTKSPPYWAFNRWENQLLLSIHHMDRRTLDDYISRVIEFSPVFIQGHPSGIARLSEHILLTDQKIKVRAVFTTGETLTPDQRRVIESAFDCEVFDFYGQGEGLFYAGECERHSGLHEFSYKGIIELLDHQADGTATVVGTSLHNYAMPMLRYEIGDFAVAPTTSVCQCGRGYPLKIAHVIGRVDDRVFLSERTDDYLLPVTIRMHIKPLLRPGQTYQLRQRAVNQFDFLITDPLQRSPDQHTRITETLQSILGPHAHIKVQQCKTLVSEGGKIRNVVSDLAKEFIRRV